MLGLIKNAEPVLTFKQVFLYESVGNYSATLYGKRPSQRHKAAKGPKPEAGSPKPS